MSPPFQFEKRIKLACIKNEGVTTTPAIPTPLAQQSVFLLRWMVIGVATKRTNEGHGERASLSSGNCSYVMRLDVSLSKSTRYCFYAAFFFNIASYSEAFPLPFYNLGLEERGQRCL